MGFVEYNAWVYDRVKREYVRLGSRYSGGAYVVEFASDPLAKIDRMIHKGTRGFAKALQVYRIADTENRKPADIGQNDHL